MMVRFEALARDVRGTIIEPGHPEYDSARRVWNGMIDRRPRAIVRCSETADVVAAVNFAVREGLLVAVRGGGHNVAGNAVCDGGLVIDLTGLKAIAVDPIAKRARVAGGVVWGELDVATQQHGLATTGGVVPSTGVAGFTLGGGLGYLMRSHGLACDNLVSADVVTAAGAVVRAAADADRDLLWALRGGGGNFGVVTSFDFDLHATGPEIAVAVAAHPLARAGEVLRFYRDFTAAAPDTVTTYANLSRLSGAPRIGMRAVFTGAGPDPTGKLREVAAFGAPEVSELATMRYLELQRLLEPAFPPGRLNYWKANFFRDLPDEMLDIAVDAFERAPSPHCIVAFEPMGGAVARVPRTGTAFEHRDAMYSVLILAGWERADETSACVAWARALWEATRRFSMGGVYVNYLGLEGEDRVREAYGANHRRLAALKARYDPTNFFRLNQNIPPAPAGAGSGS